MPQLNFGMKLYILQLVFADMFPWFSTSPVHSPRTFERLPNKEFDLQSESQY